MGARRLIGVASFPEISRDLRGRRRRIEPFDQNPSLTQDIVRQAAQTVNMKLPTGQNFFVKRVLS
jgi:hypothetical protein